MILPLETQLPTAQVACQVQAVVANAGAMLPDLLAIHAAEIVDLARLAAADRIRIIA